MNCLFLCRTKKSTWKNLDPWSRFKDICAKKSCFRDKLKKISSEPALFCMIGKWIRIRSKVVVSSPNELFELRQSLTSTWGKVQYSNKSYFKGLFVIEELNKVKSLNQKISVISWLLRCSHLSSQLMTEHSNEFDSFLIAKLV